MSIIKHVNLQKIVAHDFRYDPRRSHTTTHHSRQEYSGRVIGLSQRPLPDNTQHPQQTNMSPAGIEPTISAGERPQTYTLDSAATGTGRRDHIACFASSVTRCVSKDCLVWYKKYYDKLVVFKHMLA